MALTLLTGRQLRPIERRWAEWHQTPEDKDVPKNNDNPAEAMKETAQNLALQAKKLREQASDLSQESSRLRRASKKARQARAKKRQKT